MGGWDPGDPGGGQRLPDVGLREGPIGSHQPRSNFTMVDDANFEVAFMDSGC